MSLFFRPEVRECRRCGIEFVAKSERQHYCGEACRRQGSPKLKRVCENCGREFELEQYLVERGQGKFCSLECYRNQTPRPERVCRICGKVFTVRTSYAEDGWGVYCSPECREREYELRRVVRACEACGTEFVVTQSVIRKGHGRFCGEACRDAVSRDYTTLVCEECGQEFSVPNSDVNRGRGKYCSRECYDRHRDAKVILTCANCGQEFETRKSQIEHRGRKFCGRRCYQLYEGETSIEVLIRVELERRSDEFIQQAEIGPYEVDFLLPRRKKVIECDGSYWHSLPDNIIRDRRKDTYLTHWGYQVYRLSEEDILRSPETCVGWVFEGC